jgi:hypothetical protein
MSLRQLRNHAISFSFGPSTLRPVSAAGGDGRVIFGLQSGTGSRPAIRGPGTTNNQGPFASLGCTSGAASSID